MQKYKISFVEQISKETSEIAIEPAKNDMFEIGFNEPKFRIEKEFLL